MMACVCIIVRKRSAAQLRRCVVVVVHRRDERGGLLTERQHFHRRKICAITAYGMARLFTTRIMCAELWREIVSAMLCGGAAARALAAAVFVTRDFWPRMGAASKCTRRRWQMVGHSSTPLTEPPRRHGEMSSGNLARFNRRRPVTHSRNIRACGAPLA